MSEKKRLTANTIFYFIYQCILFVAPLVIMPYLTRVFSESTIGVYSFSYASAYYFVLLANLGISVYGQREIASHKDDKDVLARKFWSIYYVHFVLSMVAIGAYIVFMFISKQVSVYVFIIPYVVSVLFDVTWFFYGLENFRLVTLINSLFTICKVGLIFLFVKNDDCLWVYQLINFGVILMSQITIFGFAMKTIGKPVKPNGKECISHLKPIAYFAIAAIALTLYTYVDKTLMGLMINDSKKSVAFYECADKIIAVPRMLITILGAVLYPKMCKLSSDNEEDKIKKFTIFSIDWTVFLAVGSMVGLLAVSVPFAIIYYGESYITSGYYMMMMVPLIFIISLGSICRTQYILPMKKDRVFLIAICMNAVINLTLNIILIRFIGVYGVIIASIVSETVALVFQLFYCRKFFPFKYFLKSVLVHAISAGLMFGMMYLTKTLLSLNSWKELLANIFVGCISYVGFVFLFSWIFKYKNVITKVLSKETEQI